MRKRSNFHSSLLKQILSHWRGELGVARVLVYLPCLVILAMLFPVTIAVLCDALLDKTPLLLKNFLLTTVVSILAAGWFCWSWGVHRTALRMMEEGKLLMSLILMLLFAWSMWVLFVEILPEPVVAFGERLAKAVTQDTRRPRVPYLTDKPWQVIAYPELKRIIATGDIGYRSAAELQRVILAHPGLKLLELDSRGGWVSEERQMIEMVRQHQLDTLVIERCVSACTGIYLAGSQRFVGPKARFGFHQSGYDGRPHDTVWAIPEYETSIEYREKGLSETFIQKALNTSYYSIWRVDALDAKRAGFATAWWEERPARYR